MRYLVNGEEADVALGVAEVRDGGDRLFVRSEAGSATAVAVRAGAKTLVSFRGRVFEIERVGQKRSDSGHASSGEVRAPMPGQIVETYVAVGEQVVAGQKMMILEAMKMQQPILAPIAGTVRKIAVAKGDQVVEGQELAQVTDEQATDA